MKNEMSTLSFVQQQKNKKQKKQKQKNQNKNLDGL